MLKPRVASLITISMASNCKSLEGRDAPPLHYTFKIQSLSLLWKAPNQSVISGKFQAGDYKWRLVIFPDGDKASGGEDHVSIYLEMVNTDSLAHGWKVNAIVNLFVFNQLTDEYCHANDGKSRRFHSNKTKWGYPRFLPLSTFKDSSNGYLVNDTCIFGAEVFTLKDVCNEDCLTMFHNPRCTTHTWKLENLSDLRSSSYDSEPFTCGNYKWYMTLYPNGNGSGKFNSISLYLNLDGSNLPSDTQLYVKFSLSLPKFSYSKGFADKTDCCLFGPSPSLSFGWKEFISVETFNGIRCDEVQATVTLLGSVKPDS